MDTVLRDGKVVYSQACWLLGLSGFANLLNLVDKKEEARRIQSIAARIVNSIESKMWSEKVNTMSILTPVKLQGMAHQRFFIKILFFIYSPLQSSYMIRILLLNTTITITITIFCKI